MTRLLFIVVMGLLVAACASNKTSTGTGLTSGLGIQPGFDTTGLTQQQILQHQAVFFDYDKTDVKQQYVPLIESHAKYLTQHPNQTVLLLGNTDVRGSREYNLALGDKRSHSVGDVMMANGVPSSQIMNVSYGAEVPLSCGKNEAAYALNRRVDIMYCDAQNCKQVAKNYAKNLCTYPE